MNLFKAAVSSATNAVNSAVTRMTSYPDEVMCANGECKSFIPVPYFTFSWFCNSQHLNDVSDEICTQCGVQKSSCVAKDVKYVIVCPFCTTKTNVPTNNFTASLTAGVRSAPENAKSAYEKTVSGAKQMVSVPKTFPCQHCCGTLNTPQGAWTCECGQDNEEAVSKCAKCSKFRFAAGVSCSICSKITQVPSLGVSASFKSGFNSVQANIDATQRIADARAYGKCIACSFVVDFPDPNQPCYITCPRCNTSATYNDDATRNTYKSENFVVPNVVEGAKPTGNCACCPLIANRQCMVCQKGFCNPHSSYIRRHPTQADIDKQSVCKRCVVDYDNHFMPAFIMAAHPLAQKQ